MPTILHAADIHLDSPLVGLRRYQGAPVERVHAATRRALENLIGLALEESVSAVLIAGDLYDGAWKDANTGLFFNAQVRRLREAEIPVFVVAGNHDAQSVIARRLKPPANLTYFRTDQAESVHVAGAGLVLHGRGYPRRHVHDDISEAYPEAARGLLNVGLLHTSLNGRPGHDPYAPCSVAGLRRKGYAYWALGHVHTREVVSESPWIVFPGNLQGRHLRETGSKGCMLVRYEGEELVGRPEHRACDVVRWDTVEVDVSDCADADAALEEVEVALEGALEAAEGRLLAARIRLVGASAAHSELLRHRDDWRGEVENLANELGEVYLADLEFATQRTLDWEGLRKRGDALAALAAPLDAGEGPSALRNELIDDLQALSAQLRGLDRKGLVQLPQAGDLGSILERTQRRVLERLTDERGAG